MTKESFDNLPLLLTRHHVMAITGWSRKIFYARIKEGILRPANLPTDKWTRIPKHQLLVILYGEKKAPIRPNLALRL